MKSVGRGVAPGRPNVGVLMDPTYRRGVGGATTGVAALTPPASAAKLPGMSDDLNAAADARLEEALARLGARDPREFYRERLRELKQADAQGYEGAVAYYRDTLIPSVASGTVDPLAAWTEYGRRLAEAVSPGRTVAVDGTGLAHPYSEPAPGDHLVLHLPGGRGGRALLVGLPAHLTDAQRATYDVLVSGKQKQR